MYQVFHLGIKAIIQNAQGDVLLLKRQRQEGWDLPGGRMHEGEEAIETLKREIKEETGLTELANITPHKMVLAQGMVLKHFHANVSKAASLILWIHTCELMKNQPVLLSPEHQEFQWIERDKAQDFLSIVLL